MRFFCINLTCFLLLFSCSARAQGPIIKNYTTSDGLAANRVFYSMQDSYGFMWFATDNGVSRFDGTRFKNFSVTDGLSDNTVLKIVEDAEGRLWFLTFNGQLSFYKKGIVYNSSNCEFLRKIQFKNFITYFFQDSKKNIWISTADNVAEISVNDEVKEFNLPAICKCIWEDSFNKIRLLGEDGLFVFNDTGFVKTPLPFNVDFGRPLPGHKQLLVETKNSDMAILNDTGKLTKITGEENYTGLNGFFIISQKKNQVWATGAKGAIEFDDGIISKTNEHRYLENYSITSVAADKDGDLWFSSARSGVFMISSLALHLYDVNSGLADNNITALAYTDDSSLLVGTYNGSVQLIDKGKIKDILKPFAFKQRSIVSIEKDKAGAFWIASESPVFKYKDGKLLFINPNKTSWNKTLFISANDTPWIGTGRGVSRIINDTIDNVYVNEVNRVNAINQLKSNELLLGTDNGLYSYKNRSMVADTFNSPLLKHRINALAVTTDSTFWIATNAYGLLSVKNNRVKQFTTKENLLSMRCIDLLADGNSVYIVTDKGLNLLTEKNNEAHIVCYSLGNKAISSHINGVIKKNKNIIALATDFGVIEFDTRTVPVFYSNTPYIYSITVNDSSRSPAGNCHFKYNQNSISFEFGAINFNATGNLNYRYKLMGVDTNWSYTTYTAIKYPSLHPGDYKFIVTAQNADGTWNNEPAYISFYIEAAWWQTWWFKIITVAATVGIIALITLWRFRIYRQKMKRERAVVESELKALRGQINPHFVFNSLNGIQELVMENKKEDANIYFSKFATLLRSILTHSRESEITLKQEIDALKLYLELEVLRYNHRFDFQFDMDSAINPENIYIPSMVLQPYIENAVLHGLAPLKKGGKLIITFKLEKDFIICSIEDNGIGRKRSAEAKQKSSWSMRPSLGMTITKERIDLINVNQKQKINLNINDLEDTTGTPMGTRVTVYFPVNDDD